MGFAAAFTLIVVVLMLVGLVLELHAPDVIVFSALGVLLLTDVISVKDALAGFSNSGMLTVAILFIVAYAAQSSGLLGFFAGRIMGRSGDGRRTLLKMMTPVAAVSAFLNNTPIVAMFTPIIRDWALKHKLSPSKFLIPLSYASIFGGTCTLIGTSTNLVVNGLMQQSFQRSLSMFELAWVGVPCAVAGIVYVVFFGRHLLPSNPALSEEFSGGGREYLLEMKVPKRSPLIGKTVAEAGLRNLDQLFLSEIERRGSMIAPVKSNDVLEPGDHLHFIGVAEGVMRVQTMPGLAPSHGRDFCRDLQKTGNGRVIEAVVSRSSPMLGKTIKEGNFRARYDAVVLAVHRHGGRLAVPLGRLVLKPGDTLLLLAGDDFFKRWNNARDFYMISKVTDMPTVNRRKTIISLAALGGMVALSAFGVLSILKAAILTAIVLLVTRCVTVVEARRSIELNVLIVIASALGISKALEATGAAGFLAQYLIGAADGMGPIVLLAAIYLITSIATEVITNNAAAALIFPIAVATATQAGLDPKPFAIAIAIAASASFATPIGYQTNLMVYGPGGYRFRDFLKIGIPLNLLFMVVTVFVVPMVWKF
jgi:di/tricarboxylate transporter